VTALRRSALISRAAAGSRPGRGAGDDRGSMAVEVVVLVPILLLVLSLIVGFGRYVSTQGDARAVAREAVRAATIARSQATAAVAAQQAADASTPDDLRCDPVDLGGTYEPGGIITVTVRCRVSWAGLADIGLLGGAEVTATSAAPLDRFRRTDS